MTATTKTFARFDSLLLHDLEPIIRSAAEEPERPSIQGVMIEPVSIGGVLLIATDGRALAVCYDPDGKASHAFRAHIPDSIFRAATPRKPVLAIYQGESDYHEMPDWAQPENILIYDELCFVTASGKHPSDEEDTERHILGISDKYSGSDHFKILGGKIINWRRAVNMFQPSPGATAPHAYLDVTLLNLFSRLCRNTKVGASCLAIELPISNLLPVRLRSASNPFFVGFLMPVRQPIDAIAPEWFSNCAAEHDASKTEGASQ